MAVLVSQSVSQSDKPCLTEAFQQKRSSFAKLFVLLTALLLASSYGTSDGFAQKSKDAPELVKKYDRRNFTSLTSLPKATPVAGTDFVKISAGKMNLGSDGSYQVTITRPYEICSHEVTQKEYETYCKYGGTAPSGEYGKGDNFPAYYVNWYDAVVYCNLRSMAEGRTPCYKLNGETDPKKWSGIVGGGTVVRRGTGSLAAQRGRVTAAKYCGPSDNNTGWNSITCDFNANGYRLPTEAEWEIAARGGLTGNVWAGTATESELGKYAWYKGNSGNKTHEVKTKQANGYGLYDMSGNVEEWCWDGYNGNYTGTATNPTGPASDDVRMYRSSSWRDDASNCRVVGPIRGNFYPRERYPDAGFRVVRTAR